MASKLVDGVRFVASGSRVMLRGTSSLIKMARGGSLRDQLRPWMRFNRVQDVPWELVASQGVRAVLFDLENTLIPPGGPFTDEARAVLSDVRRSGMAAGVVTNCAHAWARDCLEAEGIVYVAPAHKPGTDGFLECCRKLGVKPSQAMYVGDQMITDVFGAARTGMRAILLEPRWPQEAFSSKFQRVVSKAILRVLE